MRINHLINRYQKHKNKIVFDESENDNVDLYTRLSTRDRYVVYSAAGERSALCTRTRRGPK